MVDIFDSSLDNIKVELSDNRLKIGEEVNLQAKDPTINNILIGVGWDLNAFDTDTLDLDISCFLLNREGKTVVNEDFVFYNNPKNVNEAVVHNGDNRTGAGDGDDESISINLLALSYEVMEISFVFSIYNGIEKGQNFTKLRNSYIRVVNLSNSNEICRYDVVIDDEESAETGMIVAILKREGPKWHFKAVGERVEGGLATIAQRYDIITQGTG